MPTTSTKPTIQVSTASADFVFVCLPIDKAGNHVIERPLAAFPRPVPTSGQVAEPNYGPHPMETQVFPLGIGLKNQYHAKRIWDGEFDGRFSAGFLPRLATSATFPAEVAAVQFRGFFHAIGELFVFGTGISTSETADEALLYWDNTNLADTTAKDDLASANAGAFIVTAGCEHVGRAYISVRGTMERATGGGFNVRVGRSNVGSATVWNVQSDTASASFLTAPYRILSDGLTMFCVDNTSTGTLIVKSSADDGVTWPTTEATILSTSTPRGAALYGDGTTTPVLDYWLTTAEGLYHVDISSAALFTRRVDFQHPESTYSGQLLLTSRGLLFTDGPNVFLGLWDEGVFTYKDLGLNNDDGLPLTKQGDITWVAYDNILDQVAVGKGGLAASRNQSIFFYDFKTGLWSACMALNATANRASFAGAYSTETDGISRLHFTRDNGVANDSEGLYLDFISENPDVQTSATFATTGQITRSRFDGHAPSFKKGFLKGRYRADSLTADESLSIKYATNGGALGTAQTITAGPIGELWTDGATTALGTDAQDIYDEVTLARVAGTNTNTPKLRSMGWAYKVVPLADISAATPTALKSFTFRISLNPADYEPGSDVESAKDARDRLNTLVASRTLLTLAFGQDYPVGSGVKVQLDPFESTRMIGNVRDQIDVPFDPAGFVDCTFSMVL